jgi:hypothetical protein
MSAAEIKSDLRDLYITAAKQVDVSGCLAARRLLLFSFPSASSRATTRFSSDWCAGAHDDCSTFDGADLGDINLGGGATKHIEELAKCEVPGQHHPPCAVAARILPGC